MKRALVLVASLLFVYDAAAQCPAPPNDATHTLTGWTVQKGAKDDGGVVKLGEDPKAKASKSFDCGSKGGNCNITFPIAASTSGSRQSMTVRFSYPGAGGPKQRSITFHRQMSNPVQLSLPSCGKITVEISADAAGAAKLEFPSFWAGPFHFECRDCKLKERGTKGN